MNKINIMAILTIVFFIGAGISTCVAQDINSEGANYETESVSLSPDLVYSPTSHDFGNVAQGQTYQTTFQIWNGGSSTLTWNLGIVDTWISPSPTSGSSTGILDKVTVTVTINTAGLSLGSHSGFVSISANDGGGLRYFDIYCNVVSNNPPNTPSPLSGPSTGVVAVPIAFTTSTTDPDDDNIYYGFDSNGDSITDWWTTNSYPSGSTVTIHITFYGAGTYNLRVQAKDIHGALSGFSTTKTIVISGSSNNPPSTPIKPIGPSTGKVDTSYTFSTSSIDSDGDQIKYGWDWDDDDVVDEWTDFSISGQTVNTIHSWSTPGTYQIKVVARDEHGAESSFSAVKTIIITDQSAPNKPSIPDGANSGKAGISYTYTSTSTDPDGDNIYYFFDWDDGTTSDWLGPYLSGQEVSVSHIWSAQGSYGIKVKAKDEHGLESVWSDPLEISMPKAHSQSSVIYQLLRMLQGYPSLFSLFQQ